MAMDEIDFGGKTYISSKRAAKMANYTNDYVGQLCREGRVSCRRIGRDWYVKEESILEHKSKKERGTVRSSSSKEKSNDNTQKSSLSDKMGILYYKKDSRENTPLIKKDNLKKSKNSNNESMSENKIKIEKNINRIKQREKSPLKDSKKHIDRRKNEFKDNKTQRKKGKGLMKGFVILLIIAILVLFIAIFSGGVLKSKMEYQNGLLESRVSI